MERKLILMLLAFALIIGSVSVARADDLCADARENLAIEFALGLQYQSAIDDYETVQAKSLDTKGNDDAAIGRREQLQGQLRILERKLGEAERSLDDARTEHARLNRELVKAHIECKAVVEIPNVKIVPWRDD